MNLLKTWGQRCAILTFFALSFAAIAADVSQTNADIQEQIRQQERLRLLREQQEPKPDARGAGEQLKSTVPIVADIIPDNETPCFIVAKIGLAGDSANQFQFALNEVLNNTPDGKPILGRCLGVVGINAVMARVQNAIIAKGYITTRVLAAPQDLKAGVLLLTVIPGRVNAIRFTPDSSNHVSAWNALPINTGDILNLRDIEQALENFKRVPTAEADIQIEPANVKADASQNNAMPGFSDVVIRYQQRFPVRISVGLDDSGSNSTGKYQGSTTLSGDNLLSLNDLFYINYNHDLGGGDSGKRGTKGYTVHYSTPWDYWLFSTTTSSNDYHQEVAGASQNYLYSGTSQNAEVKLSRLVYRNSINKTNLSLRGFLRKSNNFIDDTEVEVQRRRTAGWEFGFNQSWYVGKSILDYNLAYRRGTGAQDALKAPEEGFGEGTSRMKMLLGDLNLNVPFSAHAPWGNQPLQYSATLRGQVNYTPLTPQDRFSIGSRFTVRGFDGQQTLIADHGWLMRNELIAPIAASGQSLYWGLDYGEVGGQSSKNLIGKYLAGTVVGLRGGAASRFGGLNYDVFLGKPINKPQGFATHQSVAGFNLNYAY
ncbi:MAG: ShlB/FhaC/HecB family hemolysin secretion/activation protein [Methylotenera sp.]|nr:ShlB/FhaC/HecB family hemolysin secretion/activation protein [Methylotenera sp.]